MANANNRLDQQLMDTVYDKLREYAKELYGTEDSEYSVNTFTLDKLIDSHRRLREASNLFHNERWEEMAKAREAARAEYEMYTRKREYLKVSELRNMTLQEIVDLLGRRAATGSSLN